MKDSTCFGNVCHRIVVSTMNPAQNPRAKSLQPSKQHHASHWSQQPQSTLDSTWPNQVLFCSFFVWTNHFVRSFSKICAEWDPSSCRSAKALYHAANIGPISTKPQLQSSNFNWVSHWHANFSPIPNCQTSDVALELLSLEKVVFWGKVRKTSLNWFLVL